MASRFSAVLFLFVLAGLQIGCGGSGSSSETNPDGTFSMDMIPTADAASGSFFVELDVSGGNIQEGFAQLVFPDYEFVTTTKVFGIASTGFMEGTADFGKAQLDFFAEYSLGQWSGTYTLRDGLTILEEGDLSIDRTGSGTQNVAAVWTGVFDYGKGIDNFDMEIAQKGNFLDATGTIDGVPFTGGGSIVGRSLSLELDVPLDGVTINLLALTSSNGNTMEGDGLVDGSIPFTLTGERE
jgi:hypothetical protein